MLERENSFGEEKLLEMRKYWYGDSVGDEKVLVW